MNLTVIYGRVQYLYGN